MSSESLSDLNQSRVLPGARQAAYGYRYAVNSRRYGRLLFRSRCVFRGGQRTRISLKFTGMSNRMWRRVVVKVEGRTDPRFGESLSVGLDTAVSDVASRLSRPLPQIPFCFPILRSFAGRRFVGCAPIVHLSHLLFFRRSSFHITRGWLWGFCCDEGINSPHTTLWVHAGCC